MTKPADVAKRQVRTEKSADTLSLQALLELQRAAFLRDGIPDAQTRIDRINRLQSLLLNHAEELAEALNEDFGTRPRELSMAADVAGCMVDLAHQKKHLTSWMKTSTPGKWLARAGLRQELRHDPKGVIGIMGPWNFPLNLTIVPAGSAFAAGNRVLIRPSSVTAKTTAVLAKYAPRYFDLEELAVLTSAHGGGSDFAKLEVDHMFFTGSPEVGASVAAEAGKNLVPVSLELGGKNPVVVDADADIAKAATRIADARLVNGGQVCLCPDYVWVPEAKLGEFTDRVLARWRTNLPTIKDNPHYTSTINEKNFNRIVGLIDDAESLGATKHQVIPAGEKLPDAGTRKIPPTLLTGVKAGMKIEEDEVFGPVLTVYPYRELDEAITHITSHPHPLTMYWHGDRNDRFYQLADSTRSGSINGNDFALNMFGPDLPFGGIGRSGMGGYHGKTGFDTFSHTRAVAFSSMKVAVSEMMSAPFTPRDVKTTNFQLKFWSFLTKRSTKKNRRK
ncbi:aldehyde dehydrogenase family protein [Williamsia sp.]|uniref:aldehyde dehydrogenase family protein n=1 Tax=Williamsia sp. TaxID=1872085 RepID=UPI002F94BAD1